MSANGAKRFHCIVLGFYSRRYRIYDILFRSVITLSLQISSRKSQTFDELII